MCVLASEWVSGSGAFSLNYTIFIRPKRKHHLLHFPAAGKKTTKRKFIHNAKLLSFVVRRRGGLVHRLRPRPRPQHPSTSACIHTIFGCTTRLLSFVCRKLHCTAKFCEWRLEGEFGFAKIGQFDAWTKTAQQTSWNATLIAFPTNCATHSNRLHYIYMYMYVHISVYICANVQISIYNGWID